MTGRKGKCMQKKRKGWVVKTENEIKSGFETISRKAKSKLKEKANFIQCSPISEINKSNA